MTCEEFRSLAPAFSLEAPHTLILALFTHMAQCPHCEELVAHMARQAPPLDPQQAAACAFIGKTIAKEQADGR